MPDALSHVAYLSQKIGPRPAGTEEEQQAALYITEQFQKEAGFSAVIEDFNSASSADLPRAVCSLISCVALVLSLIFSILLIPAFVISLIAAILYISEVVHRPILSRFMPQGVSQNVVAKYEPSYDANTASSRRRKIILVARYDSGKVQPETNGALLEILPIVQRVTLVSIMAIPIVLLMRSVFFSNADGAAALVLTVVSVLLLVSAILPALTALVHKVSAYNEAANSNAAGVAVMLEIARRIGTGRVSEAELARYAAEQGQNLSLHGEAEAEYLVPEGARLVYEASQVEPPEMIPQSPEERLTSAKAALAAFTGQPVSESVPATDISANLVNVKDMQIDAPTEDSIHAQREETRAALSGEVPGGAGELDGFVDAADLGPADLIDLEDATAAGMSNAGAALGVAGAAGAAAGAVAGAAGDLAAAGADAEVLFGVAGDAGAAGTGVGGEADEPAVPDWFAKARANAQAKNPHDEGLEASQRSRYADAFDALEAAQAEAAAEAVRQAQAAAEEARAAAEAALAAQVALLAEAQRVSQQGKTFGTDDMSAAAGDAPAAWQDGEQDSEAISADLFQDELQGEFQDELGSQFEDIADAGLNKKIADGQISLSDETIAVPPIDESDLQALYAQESETEPETTTNQRRSSLQRSTVSLSDTGQIAAPTKQRAPLADAQTSGVVAAKGLLNMIPSIDVAELAAEQQGLDPTSVERIGQAARPSLFADLPSLSGGIPNLQARAVQSAQAAEKAQTAADEQGAKPTPSARSLVLPSLSGLIDREAIAAQGAQGAQAADDASGTDASGAPGAGSSVVAASIPDFEAATESSVSAGVSKAGAFVSASATSSFDPVGNELIQDVAPDEIYVDDVDDSDYDTSITETGAFAGPGYVEMPKSRMQRLFGRFRSKKKREEETSAQEWLHVDDGFDARTVGAERGSWESFRQEEDDFAGFSDDANDVETDRGSRAGYTSGGTHGGQRWQGGAFSRRGARAADDAVFEDDVYAEDPMSYDTLLFDQAAYDSAAYEAASIDPSAQEGSSDYEGYGAYEGSAAAAMADSYAYQGGADLSAEMRQIYQFRHPDIDTEVWFVALGSELAGNAGMSAFLAEHGSELRGAIIINLNGLGAGDLCLVEKEGSYRPIRASSRMKRYVQKASQASGIPAGSASVTWSDLSSTFATRRGFQAMTIMGADGDKPAYFAQADDMVENVSIDTLNSNIDFVMELLKKI